MALRIFRRLRDLLDVNMTGVGDGDAVVYDSGTDKFIAGSAGAFNGGTITDPLLIEPAGFGGTLSTGVLLGVGMPVEADLDTKVVEVRNSDDETVFQIHAGGFGDVIGRDSLASTFDVWSVATPAASKNVFGVHSNFGPGSGTTGSGTSESCLTVKSDGAVEITALTDTAIPLSINAEADPTADLIRVELSGDANPVLRLAQTGMTVVLKEPDWSVLLIQGPPSPTEFTDFITAVPDAGGSGAFRVLESGAILTAAHSAPSDDVLSSGDCALWFDQTNGAAKLMVKGKTANGTVVTGNVPLT